MQPRMITVKMDTLTWNLVRDMLVIGRDSWVKERNASRPDSARHDIASVYVLQVETAILAFDEADLLDKTMAVLDPPAE